MTMPIAVLGIDLGKNSCSVVGLDGTGRVVLKRRLHRDGVTKLAASLPACVMAMEACCGAHHLGRVLRGQGHEIRLISPEFCLRVVSSILARSSGCTRSSHSFTSLSITASGA